MTPRTPPRYTQLADDLRDRIRAGEITGRLPAAAALALRHQVSRSTARRALRSLADDGLIALSLGHGYYAAHDPADAAAARARRDRQLRFRAAERGRAR